MSLLYPIIRRVRRPLVPVDPVPKVVPTTVEKAPLTSPSGETIPSPSIAEVEEMAAETPKKKARAKKATEPGD